YNGKLPTHVHCMMDEFANIALPDEFDKLLATMRSREISVSIILQNIAQLKALFEKQWESIVGNCDEFLFLGGNEQSTHKYVSELLGKSTIDTNTYGKSTGHSGNYSTNYQISGRELYTPDEVRMLDNRYAILFIRGERAIRDEKFDIMRHSRISNTTDGSEPPYCHGLSPHSMDTEYILLDGIEDDFEILSDEEVFEWLEQLESEKENSEHEESTEKNENDAKHDKIA
ncbi:MAG: TraG/TraD/VirD4 family protein, partial [Christensenella sp.]